MEIKGCGAGHCCNLNTVVAFLNAKTSLKALLLEASEVSATCDMRLRYVVFSSSVD